MCPAHTPSSGSGRRIGSAHARGRRRGSVARAARGSRPRLRRAARPSCRSGPPPQPADRAAGGPARVKTSKRPSAAAAAAVAAAAASEAWPTAGCYWEHVKAHAVVQCSCPSWKFARSTPSSSGVALSHREDTAGLPHRAASQQCVPYRQTVVSGCLMQIKHGGGRACPEPKLVTLLCRCWARAVWPLGRATQEAPDPLRFASWIGATLQNWGVRNSGVM